MNTKVKKIVEVAIFSAVALVVSLLSVPLPFIPNFYKIDLSTVVAVIVGYKYNWKLGVLVELIKNILSVFLFGSNTMMIGEAANFIMGASFIIPVVILRKKIKFSECIGIVSLSIIGCVLNYFVLLPLYAAVFNMSLDSLIGIGHALNPMINSLWMFILLAVLPFNLIKGIILSIVSDSIYKRI